MILLLYVLMMLLIPAYLIVRANRIEKKNSQAAPKDLWPNFPSDTFSENDALVGVITKGVTSKMTIKDMHGKELGEVDYALVYGQNISFTLSDSRKFIIKHEYLDDKKFNSLLHEGVVVAKSSRRGVTGSWGFLNRIFGADWRFKNSSYQFGNDDELKVEGGWASMLLHKFPVLKSGQQIGVLRNLSPLMALAEVYGAVIPSNYAVEFRVFVMALESRRF